MLPRCTSSNRVSFVFLAFSSEKLLFVIRQILLAMD